LVKFLTQDTPKPVKNPHGPHGVEWPLYIGPKNLSKEKAKRLCNWSM